MWIEKWCTIENQNFNRRGEVLGANQLSEQQGYDCMLEAWWPAEGIATVAEISVQVPAVVNIIDLQTRRADNAKTSECTFESTHCAAQ